MTLTKESLREALDPNEWGHVLKGDAWYMPDPDSSKTVLAAARFTERLLPGDCGGCDASGYANEVNDDRCADCHGTGQVWDEGLVEVVAKALEPVLHYGLTHRMARAVLAALTAEVGK